MTGRCSEGSQSPCTLCTKSSASRNDRLARPREHFLFRWTLGLPPNYLTTLGIHCKGELSYSTSSISLCHKELETMFHVAPLGLRKQWFSISGDFAHQGTFSSVGDIFGHHAGMGCSWNPACRGEGATKHPKYHAQNSPHHTESAGPKC